MRAFSLVGLESTQNCMRQRFSYANLILRRLEVTASLWLAFLNNQCSYTEKIKISQQSLCDNNFWWMKFCFAHFMFINTSQCKRQLDWRHLRVAGWFFFNFTFRLQSLPTFGKVICHRVLQSAWRSRHRVIWWIKPKFKIPNYRISYRCSRDLFFFCASLFVQSSIPILQPLC